MAGFQVHLAKPVAAGELVSTIVMLAGRGVVDDSGSREAGAPIAQAAHPPSSAAR